MLPLLGLTAAGLLASSAVGVALGTGIVASLAASAASYATKKAITSQFDFGAGKVDVPVSIFTGDHPEGLTNEEAAERYSTSFGMHLLARRIGHSGMIGAVASTDDGMPYTKYWDLASPFASAAPSQGIADSMNEFHNSVESTEQFQRWAGMKLQEPEMFGEGWGNVAGYNGAVHNPTEDDNGMPTVGRPSSSDAQPSIEDLQSYNTADEYIQGETARISRLHGRSGEDPFLEYPEWASNVVNDYIIFQEAYLKQGGNYSHDENYQDRLSELGYSRDEDFWDGNGNETEGADFMEDEGRAARAASSSNTGSSSSSNTFGLFADALAGIGAMSSVGDFDSVDHQEDIISDDFDTNLLSDSMMDNEVNWNDYTSDPNVQMIRSAGGDRPAMGYIQQQASWNKIINNQSNIIGVRS
jgi:hypothetical protein